MFQFKKIINILILSVLFLLPINSANAQEINYYENIVKDWNKIFPDRNRNAAGPKFFKYILDKDNTYKDFVEYNKLYCAVSGSLISPDAEPEFIYMSEDTSKNKICGSYYRCCIPCSCDIMKYSKTKKMKHKFKDGEKEFYVFTIENPCGKSDFPRRVNKDYFCDGNKLDSKQVTVLDGKLVIGLFHDTSPCTNSKIAMIDKHQVTGQFCEFRNNTPIDQLQSGMGDIFIKLAR